MPDKKLLIAKGYVYDELCADLDQLKYRNEMLEAALRGLYEHTKNNHQIAALNEEARKALEK